MALTKEQAINLIEQNEDKEARKFFADWDIAKLLDFFYTCLRYYPDKSGRYGETLREIDRRIESCDLPDLLAPMVYETLLDREDIEYLRNL